jgi:phosphoribosylformylglycinamidine synthase I
MEETTGGYVMKPRVLVPYGNGLNCEDETVYSWELAGAEVMKVHLNDLMERPKMLEDFQISDFIGGFVDGDHISAAKIDANRLRYTMSDEIIQFIHEGKLVIGVCNGFQKLVKAGILPGLDGDYRTVKMTVTYNDSGKFEDRWVHLGVNYNSNCVWTKGLVPLMLPVRHGEGKVRIKDPEIMRRLKENNQIVVQYVDPETRKPTMGYPYNPNGADEAIAGICDPTGRVFGMMPHREAYLSPYNNPFWTRYKAEGMMPEPAGRTFSKNAVEYAIEKLV